MVPYPLRNCNAFPIQHLAKYIMLFYPHESPSTLFKVQYFRVSSSTLYVFSLSHPQAHTLISSKTKSIWYSCLILLKFSSVWRHTMCIWLLLSFVSVRDNISIQLDILWNPHWCIVLCKISTAFSRFCFLCVHSIPEALLQKGIWSHKNTAASKRRSGSGFLPSEHIILDCSTTNRWGVFRPDQIN